MNKVKIYRMNDCEWWASKWNMKDTNEWYKKEYGLTEEDNPLEEVKEVDLDQEGIWWFTEDKKDIERLGDSNELTGVEIVDGMHKTKIRFGDLMRKGEEVFKYISFREALEKEKDFEEPYCIASTEW